MQLTARPQELEMFRQFTLSNILTVFAILGVTWLLIRYSTRLLEIVSARRPRVRFLIKWAEPILRLTLWFMAILICFDLLTTANTRLAAIGSMAIAVGLGAQDLIKNLVGGLVILADRPYQLGDRVDIGDASGEIDHIGLRSTKLTTFGDTRVTIPNANILNEKVFNANSGVPDCQVETFLYLPIDTDPNEAVRIGYEAAYTCPYLHSAKPVLVLVADGFDQMPYLKLHIKAYVFDHRFLPRMQSDITSRAKTEFLRLGLLDSWRTIGTQV